MTEVEFWIIVWFLNKLLFIVIGVVGTILIVVREVYLYRRFKNVGTNNITDSSVHNHTNN